jgi:hypothetical protein
MKISIIWSSIKYTLFYLLLPYNRAKARGLSIVILSKPTMNSTCFFDGWISLIKNCPLFLNCPWDWFNLLCLSFCRFVQLFWQRWLCVCLFPFINIFQTSNFSLRIQSQNNATKIVVIILLLEYRLSLLV